MKYRYLGNSGLAVSTICLGTATFGQKEWGCNENTATDILNGYIEQGGNFIDTADQYADTASETIIGKWLGTQKRDELVITSKCFFPIGNDINSKGLSRKHIVEACDASLRRLKTDYIDLYQLHNQDPQTPLEETMAALDFLVQQGKVRYIGLSNYPGWKVMKLSNISYNKNYPNMISGQYLYNLLKRDVEKEILPACNDVGMGLMCWSPLSGGMLTGKYAGAKKPPKGTRLDLRSDVVKDKYQSWQDKSFEVVQKVKEIAATHKVSPTIVSLAWLLKNKNIASVLVGSSKPEQIIESCKASEWVISNEDWDILDNQSKTDLSYPDDILNYTTKDWFNEIL